MKTIDEYADGVERRTIAALKLAIHRLSASGSLMERAAAEDLRLVLDHADFEPLLDAALTADGLDVRVDPADGLRYVVQAVAA